MWRILKAEFRYNAKILVPSYFIMTFMSMIGFFLGLEHGSFSTVAWIVYYFAFSILAYKIQKEKRERLYTGLPVTLAKIGVTRLLLLLLVYSSLTLLWIFPYFMEYSIFHDRQLWSLIAGNFLILSSLMFAIILYDLKFCSGKNYRVIFLFSVACYFALLILIVIVKGLLAEQPVQQIAAPILNWPILTIVCFIPIPVSIYLSVMFFTKRTSFLGKETC